MRKLIRALSETSWEEWSGWTLVGDVCSLQNCSSSAMKDSQFSPTQTSHCRSCLLMLEDRPLRSLCVFSLEHSAINISWDSFSLSSRLACTYLNLIMMMVKGRRRGSGGLTRKTKSRWWEFPNFHRMFTRKYLNIHFSWRLAETLVAVIIMFDIW